MIVPVESTKDDSMKKLFTNELLALGYNSVKNPYYEKLKNEIDDRNEKFREDCVEWFLNQMLEKEIYMIK